jgi:hypothetical protein
MTISSTTRKAGPFVGNGATVSFPFTFKVFATSDVVVTLTVIATGVESTLVETTNYTVALNSDQNANPGGTVSYNPSGTPMASTEELTLTSNVPQLQTLDLTNGGGFFPTAIANALDRAIILIQQLALTISQGLRVSVSDTAPGPLPSKAARALNLLGFDVNGDPIATAGGASSVVSAPMAPVVAAASLASALSQLGAAASAVTVTGTSGLAGGGDLSANRTLTLDLTAKNAWAGTQTAAATALTTSTAWDATVIQQATVNVNGSTFTIANPSAVTDKSYIAIYITFTTTNTVAWGANYKNIAQYTASATAGKQDMLLFRVNGSNLELMSYALDTGKA